VNLWAEIITYKFLDKKPSIGDFQEKNLSVNKLNIELFNDAAA
jgi:hypothetical protein